MGGRQSHYSESKREQPKKTDLPPPYSEVLNETTPFFQQGSLQVPRPPLLPIGYAGLGVTLTTTQHMERQSPGRAPSNHMHQLQRHQVAELCHVCDKALTELRAQVGTTQATTSFPLRRREVTEHERRIIEARRGTIECQEMTIQSQERVINIQDQRIRSRDKIIQSLRDELQSMSARVVAAETRAMYGKD